MDLILVRKTSRLNYFRYLYRTGYMNKSPFDLPFVDIFRVREFTFTPTLDENEDNDNGSTDDVIARKDEVDKSVWNCDGEILPDPKVRVKVHCQILPVFARGLEKHSKN
jgi:ceramide kinase